MTMDIDRQGLELQRCTTEELRQRYLDIFGEAARSHNKTWLLKRIFGVCRPWPKATSPSVPANGPPNWPAMPTCACHRHAAKAGPMATPLAKEQAKASSPSLTSKIHGCRRRVPGSPAPTRDTPSK